MGRFITHNGTNVYKYRFSNQDNELHRLDDEFSIGKYTVQTEKIEIEDDVFTEEKYGIYLISQEDVPKLKILYEDLLDGKSIEDLHSIGKNALLTHIESMSDEWNEKFKDCIESIKTSNSINDFKFTAYHGEEDSFDVYAVYSSAIEYEIKDNYAFVSMIKALIDYINTNRTQNIFEFSEDL